jgi:hypothetical protein
MIVSMTSKASKAWICRSGFASLEVDAQARRWGRLVVLLARRVLLLG